VAGFLRSCSSIAGTLAFFVGIENIGAMRATMITNLEPIFGVLLAVVVLQERLTIVQAETAAAPQSPRTSPSPAWPAEMAPRARGGPPQP